MRYITVNYNLANNLNLRYDTLEKVIDGYDLLVVASGNISIEKSINFSFQRKP